MLQYKIPQNVGIEDKIVGPFSLRQLIILAVGGGTSYIIYVISSRFYELNILEYIIIAIPALLALAAALIKIRHVSFTKYMLLLLEFTIKPKKRMWDHHGIASTVAPTLGSKVTQKKKNNVNPNEVKERKNVNLKELSATLDSGGYLSADSTTHPDIDNVKDEDLITQAYFGHKRKESNAENMYWRTRDVQKEKLNLLAKLPRKKVNLSSTKPVTQKAENELKAASKKKTTKEVSTKKLESKVNPKEESSIQVAPQKIEKKVVDKAPQKEASPTEVEPKKTEEKKRQELIPKKPINENNPPEKKKKRRRRKKKRTAIPIRENTQINTVTKTKQERPQNAENAITSKELEAGKTIEFKLD